MSNKPITSRIKRSPLFKYSPLKNEDDPKAKKFGTEKGEDKVVTETKEVRTQASKDFEAKCYNADGSRKRGVPGCKWADEEGTEAPKETETVTTKKTVEGEDIDYDTTLYKQKMGDVLQPWEKRQMSRAIKKEQRDIRRAKIKAAKKAGTLTPEMRKKFKAEEAQAELSEFEAMAKRGKAARATGRRTGTTNVQTGQEKKLKGDLSDQEQLEQAKQEALRQAKQKAAESSGITTGSSSQAAGAVDPGQQIKQMAASFDPSQYLDFRAGDYSSLLKKKSSPAKKALKGNQYKLPAHLQKAIKAAPGKLKTPLKKGYFKNK